MVFSEWRELLKVLIMFKAFRHIGSSTKSPIAPGDNIASDNSFKDLPWGFLADLNPEDRKAISNLYESEAVEFIHRSAANFLREDEGVR